MSVKRTLNMKYEKSLDLIIADVYDMVEVTLSID